MQARKEGDQVNQSFMDPLKANEVTFSVLMDEIENDTVDYVRSYLSPYSTSYQYFLYSLNVCTDSCKSTASL